MTQHSADLALAADQRRRAYEAEQSFRLCCGCDAPLQHGWCASCEEPDDGYIHRLPDWGFYNIPVAKGIGIDGGDL